MLSTRWGCSSTPSTPSSTSYISVCPIEYLKYLGGLPAIGKRIQRPLITAFTSDAIPNKKRPKYVLLVMLIKYCVFLLSSKRRLLPLHVWFVVTIGDQPQWLPMGRNKNMDDVIEDILNFIGPLRYPVLVSIVNLDPLLPIQPHFNCSCLC